MQNSGETENELRPFLQRHDRPILERQRQGRLLLIPISGSGGCDAFSPSAHRSSPSAFFLTSTTARTLAYCPGGKALPGLGKTSRAIKVPVVPSTPRSSAIARPRKG